MIERVVSGGQTGVDRAALDIALELKTPCGGWCPAGRLAEDGAVPARYPLQETPSADYAERTAWNVRDSDGTLVLTWGPPTEGTAFTVECAQEQNKPCLIVNLADAPDVEGVASWLKRHNIAVLNVAGPRASKTPHIYDAACNFLRLLFAS